MKRDEPKVIMFDDGRHASGFYQFEPPMSADDLLLNIDQLIDSGIDTYVYFAVIEGGTVMYDSKVSQVWGDNVLKWNHFVWYRASRIIKQLIAEGNDPLKLICDRCHEKGIWCIPQNPASLLGGTRELDGGLGRKSDFVYDHPEFQCGPEDDPRAELVQPQRFSMLHQDLREERLAVSEELLARYETDGIVLNMNEFVPFCRFDEVGELEPVMTEWMRSLKAVAAKAEEAQGRRKRIYIHIPAQPVAWKMLGFDVPTWVEEKLTDGLICQTGLRHGPVDHDLDLTDARNLADGNDCRVFAAFRNLLGRQLDRYATPPMVWAAAANAYAQGADGFAFTDAHTTPNGWPWTDTEYGTLRLLGNPEMLATANKIYRARSETATLTKAHNFEPATVPTLPVDLLEGEPVTVQIRISDELHRWHNDGKLDSVNLRVRITGIEPPLNKVRVELNGKELPESILNLNDLTFRVTKFGAVGPYGYIYDYHLMPDLFPKQGVNEITVTLVEHDPLIQTEFPLYDVDCVINYLVHRNFRRKPLDY